MVTHIISGTPSWVWGLFAALLWLGIQQAASRTISRGRVARMAIGMGAFSLYGTVSAFGVQAGVLLCWLAAAAAVGLLTLLAPLASGARYLPEKRAYEVPGSWVPLGLMMGLFVVKYVAGVLLAMHAPVIQVPAFGPLLGVVYGAFSGAFLGRAARLLRLSSQSQNSPAPARA